MINQQQNEIIDMETDDIDVIFRRIKILFTMGLLQFLLSCGLSYLHFGIIYFVIDVIVGIYALLLIYWCYDQNKEIIKSQAQHVETTNNFLTRFQLVISVTISVILVYSLMSYMLIAHQIDLYKYLTVGGFALQILIQIVVLTNNSYFCKSPNVLRLSIYFQSLTLCLVIFVSGIRIFQVQQLPPQLQTSDYWIEWNTFLQFPTLVLLAISMLFNYMGNKRAYNLFGTLFLIFSILHTIFGCILIRNAQFWAPENEQLPLRALHQDIIQQFGCKKYYSGDCQAIFQVQMWEENNEISCLSQDCVVNALDYLKKLHIELGLAFIFEAALLFMMTYAMYTVAVKYQISKLLNPITQKSIIVLFFAVLISGVLYFFVLPIPKISTQPSMNYEVDADLLPEFDQRDFVEVSQDSCNSINQWLDIEEFEATNCDATCKQYEFIIGIETDNGYFVKNNNIEIKSFSQEFTNQFYNKKDINSQIVLKGNKSSLVQAFDKISICTDNPTIDIKYQVDQVKLNRLLQQIDMKLIPEIDIKIQDLLFNKRQINIGVIKVYKEYISCSHIQNQPFVELNVAEATLYNVRQGQQLTIVYKNDKYFDYCGNFVASHHPIILTPLKLNNNKVTIVVSWQEDDSQFYLMVNQKIGKSINCQAGGYFTGCAHIKPKQTSRYSLLQFKEYISNAVIFLSDLQTNKSSQSLQLNVYSQGESHVRQIYYKSSDILKLVCIQKDGKIQLIQEIGDNNLFTQVC